MQYPSMGKSRQYRVTIPQLNGGVNYAVPSHLIEDNQLSDVRNMWYKDGRLQTRPCFGDVISGSTVVVADDPLFGKIQTLDTISTLEVKNKICVTSFCTSKHEDAGEKKFLVFSFFEMDGTHKKNVFYSMAEADETGSVLVVGNATEGQQNADVFALIPQGNAVKVIGASSEGVVSEVEPYVPTILKGGEPSETNEQSFNEAAMIEPQNLLTESFHCKYLSNGKGIYYFLHKQNIAATDLDSVTVEHVTSNVKYTHKITDFQGNATSYEEAQEQEDGKLVFDLAAGMFYFKKGENPAALSLTHSDDNVVFTLKSKTSTGAKTICNMRFSVWFGGGSAGLTGGTRLFVSGNSSHPCLMHWSALNNPLYFPENNYAEVGDNNQAITGFAKQSELLVVFKERELYCSYYVQGSSPTNEQLQNQQVIDIEAAQAMFPIYQLHPAVGCDCPDTIRLCNNRLVWFSSDRKVYGLFTTGQYSERNVRELSRPIEKLLQEDPCGREEMMNAVAAEYQNHYLLHIGKRVFVLDYSSYGFTYFSSYSSDEKAAKAVAWYVWDVNSISDYDIVSACDGHGAPVYIVLSSDGYRTVMLKNDLQCDNIGGHQTEVTSKMCTKLFDFGHPERLKRVNPLYLQVSGTTGKTLKITYFRDNGKVLDDYAPMLTGRKLENETPIRISTNANRVREFGIELQSDGRMAVGSITLNYSMMGTVR